ncbi:hypothetical protein LOY67_15110 [Pseudomonas sp. B21-056]|uniref:hypothetical protein n=1 Tax=Pseudomonas sp. B21-056 TaxID=2895495 RepID=UPI0022305D3A|nr:hypothetical protein [Pseudomonas sp. B21-056]UZE21377.1 hypothetical protein LOY67_15110 [Pseudomonas sp. B21-056]
MSNDPYTQFKRFQTPDPAIGPREQAPMLAQELAWARVYAAHHRFDWLVVLMAPLCFGPLLPPIALLLGVLLYRTLFVPGPDLDLIIGESLGWLVVPMLLSTTAWALCNFLRDKHDPTIRYWQSLPDQGRIELERHTLVSGFCLWSNDYDPDCNTLMLWVNDKIEHVQDSGVAQWILAKTEAGHWLVLKEQFPGNFTYDRIGQTPAPGKLLQPREQLAIAFAPGTNLPLGRRFDGAPIPLIDTSYWLSGDELKRLAEAAHHWTFFPPERYAVINEQDAGWVQRLVTKAQAHVDPEGYAPKGDQPARNAQATFLDS